MSTTLPLRPGDSVLILCAWVGQEHASLPGYLKADCSGCGAALWLSPEVQRSCQVLGLEVFPTCDDCFDGPDSSRNPGPRGGRIPLSTS